MTRKYTDQVSTITMKSTESITDYSKCFSRAVFNPSLLKENFPIVDCFFAFLTLHTIAKIAEPISRFIHADNAAEPWSNKQKRSFEFLKNALHQDVILFYAGMSR